MLGQSADVYHAMSAQIAREISLDYHSRKAILSLRRRTNDK